MPLTFREFRDFGLITEISTIYCHPGKIRTLLSEIDFPPDKIPAFGVESPRDLWTEVCRILGSGVGGTDLGRLLEQVLSDYPGNQKLAQAAADIRNLGDRHEGGTISKTPDNSGLQSVGSQEPEVRTGPPPAVRFPKWTQIAGLVIGGLTLLFLMGLVLLSVAGSVVPPNSRFLVVAVLALCIAFSTAFIGGHAAAEGRLPLPFARDAPIKFSVTSGIATFVIVLILGSLLYPSGPG